MIEDGSKGVDQQEISLKVSLAARLQGQVVCEVMALIPGAHGAGWSCSLHVWVELSSTMHKCRTHMPGPGMPMKGVRKQNACSSCSQDGETLFCQSIALKHEMLSNL